jgi:hypothetical protein
MAWKTYAWGMLLLAVITFVGRVGFHLKRHGSTTYWDLLQAVFNFIMMPALFGFVYHRAYFFRAFWEVTVPLAWVALLYGLFSPTQRKLARQMGIRVAVLVSLVSLALSLPGMLAITRYAYLRPNIWR